MFKGCSKQTKMATLTQLEQRKFLNIQADFIGCLLRVFLLWILLEIYFWPFLYLGFIPSLLQNIVTL